MGPQHQDPDYHPPIHPADMEDSDDENGDGPQTPSSAAGGDPGVFTGISARARLALAAAQSTGGPGALQALACGYSEVCMLLCSWSAGCKFVYLHYLLEDFAEWGQASFASIKRTASGLERPRSAQCSVSVDRLALGKHEVPGAGAGH